MAYLFPIRKVVEVIIEDSKFCKARYGSQAFRKAVRDSKCHRMYIAEPWDIRYRLHYDVGVHGLVVLVLDGLCGLGKCFVILMDNGRKTCSGTGFLD